MKVPHLCLIITGSVILALVISFVWLIFPKLIESQVKNNVRLVEGSDTWNAWANVTVPIQLKFFIYNVTNPTEIQEGKMPRVTEMGPYVYTEKRQKFDLKVDPEKDTVSYRQSITYFFDKEKSGGNESDLITVLNMVYVGFVEIGHKLTKDEFLLTTLDDLISTKGETLFRTENVSELLFNGFSIQKYLDLLADPIVESAVGKVKLPKAFANGRFGLFEGKNGSDEGLFEIKSGVSNYEDFGQIVSWNNASELTWWKDSCNDLKGTDGSLFRPFLTKASKLYLFASDLCRSMYVTFNSETTYKGVPAYRFSLAKELNQSPYINSDNLCFCDAPKNDTTSCDSSGVMNLATCREESPIYASSPHFHNADSKFISAIDGLSPVAEKHETFMDLEPRTGLLLRTAKRLQFSMKLKQYSYMSSFEKVKTVLFPLVWVEETAELQEGDNLNTLQTLTLIFQIVGIGKWVLLGIGACILGAGVVLASLRKAEIIPK